MSSLSSIKRMVMGLLLAVPLFTAATPAKAGQEAAIVIFYSALRISQSQAIEALANYQSILGNGPRAQEYLRVAADVKSGNIGGGECGKVLVQLTNDTQNEIAERQSLGVELTRDQTILAKKAERQFSNAKLAMIAAIASGTYAALNMDGSVFEKILVGALMAAEALKVRTALENTSKAAKAYRNFELGGNSGFQPLSKELEPQFVAL